MRILLVILLFKVHAWTQDYTWPTSLGKHLSSNFGEFRTTGYHQGLDIKTKGSIGHPVFAVSDGYISRIVSNFSGFGRALYLTLDDGQTAVYGHLSKFIPRLEDRLIDQQEKNQSYITNIFLSPGEFKFEKGDIIAYSGNTGFSFGPHLHFEIRNKKGQTLNPLTSGLNQPDRLAPIVDEISFAPLDDESWINGNQLQQNFPVFRDKKGEYHFPDTINIYGKLGISIKTYDKRQGANNIYQPHKIEMYIDGEIYHSLKFDRLDYNWQSTANFINDYRNSRLNFGNFIKLYRNDSDPKVPIHNQVTTGILDLSQGYHDIKIIVMDTKDNKRILNGTVFVMKPFDITIEHLGETEKLISFLIQPKSITIPIKSINGFSFTPYGYADEELDILSSQRVEAGRVITVSKKQASKKALQFITQNNLGTRSKPIHWIDKRFTGDHLTASLNMDISHTEAGVYIQFQPEKVLDEELSLRLKGKYKYTTIPLNQIQPSVYLSQPISPMQFQNIDQIESIINGSIERQIQFDFPYTVAEPGSSITIISNDTYCSMRSKKTSIVSPTVMWIEAVNKHAPIDNGKLISRVYQLQPFERPLSKSMNIAIRYPKKFDENAKLHLYYYDQKEGWTFIPSFKNKDRRVISGEVEHLDAIAIIEDKISPEIISIHPGNNGKYPSLELDQFRIRIDDKLSGFKADESSFDLTLDNQKLIYAYQPKLKVLTYNLKRPLSIGSHSIELNIRDRAGNEKTKSIKFDVY